MASTKLTASKSAGSKAPRKASAEKVARKSVKTSGVRKPLGNLRKVRAKPGSKFNSVDIFPYANGV